MSENLRCKQELCNVARDGKCLESLEPDKCPHAFYLESRVDDTEVTEGVTSSVAPTSSLFGGDALSVKDTAQITYQSPVEKIFIIGESECGKTTLLATIFELFQKGPIGELYFSGSYTQIGFEERCHLSRLASNSAIADTEKTSSPVFKFLHLAIKKAEQLKASPVHLLISDISGERLRSARNSSSTMQELSLLKSSSRIVYIIDGERLANSKTRNAVLFNAEQFIQRALDDEILGVNSDLRIVVSKWDMLHTGEFNFVSIIDDRFRKKFGMRLKRLSFAKIAARPSTTLEDISWGYGVYQLLAEWISPSQGKVYPVGARETLYSQRLFDNFKSEV